MTETQSLANVLEREKTIQANSQTNKRAIKQPPKQVRNHQTNRQMACASAAVMSSLFSERATEAHETTLRRIVATLLLATFR